MLFSQGEESEFSLDGIRMSIVTPRLRETGNVTVARVLESRRHENARLDQIGEYHMLKSLYKTLGQMRALKLKAVITLENGGSSHCSPTPSKLQIPRSTAP